MKILTTILAFLCFFACRSQEPVANTNQPVLFSSVHVIPMDREQVLENFDVLVQNGTIIKMGKHGTLPSDKNAFVINGKGKYLIPGMAEMHAHVPPVDDLAPMKETLILFAVNGVTNIRGMLGHPRHLELREKLRSGEIIGPRFYTSGPSFSGNSVKTPADAERMVREQKAAGYDFLKLHPGITLENFNAIVKTADETGIPFAGHVSFQVGVWRAMEAGYATIDHLDGFVEALVPGIDTISESKAGLFGMFIGDRADENKIAALTRGLKEKNIWVVPTQCLAEKWFSPDVQGELLRQKPEMKYMSPQTLESWSQSKKQLMANPACRPESIRKFIELRRKLILDCQRAGVGILSGSDAPQVFDVPGFSIHDELKYLVLSGLSPFEALATATVNVGRFYKNESMGVIREGAVSDLVLLNGNPLKDISQVGNINGVMLGKNWLSQEYIKAALKKLEKSK